MSKKSFVLHNDSLDILNQLSDQQAGKLFKAIYTYNKEGKIPKLDQILTMVITPFLSQFKRDGVSFNKSVLMGKIGNLKKYHPQIYNRYIEKEFSLEEAEAIAYPYKKEIDRPPIGGGRGRSLSVSDSVSDSDSDSVSDSDSDNDKEEDKKTKAKKAKAKKAQKEMLLDEIEKKLIEKKLIEVPEYIKTELWNEFLKIRLKRKAINSPIAISTILKKLAKFKAQGHDPNCIIENSIVGSWKDVFEPKKTTKTTIQIKMANSIQSVENSIKKYSKNYD